MLIFREIFNMRYEIPIRLYSEANRHDHWTKKLKRKKIQQMLIKFNWKKVDKRHIKLPVAIKLIRQGPRKLDDDNLVTAFKWIRDTIADLLIPGLAYGRADDSDQISFSYGQEKSKKYGIAIEIVDKNSD